MQSVVNNHALIDGNKRLGWLATAVFLELNGASVTAAPNHDVYELVMRVAADDDRRRGHRELAARAVSALAPLLRELTARRRGLSTAGGRHGRRLSQTRSGR